MRLIYRNVISMMKELIKKEICIYVAVGNDLNEFDEYYKMEVLCYIFNDSLAI